MQGLTISDLRTRGADIRHTRGINTCARCRTHYLPTVEHELLCRIHLQPVTDGQVLHPCCTGASGSPGCTPVQHLPMYELGEGGKVDQSRTVDYSTQGDLKIGRWTRVGVQQERQKENAASSSSSSSASAPTATVSSVSAPHPSVPMPLDSLGDPVPRVGDEIMVCGQLYHTGTPVILWGDVGGYDHYRVERRFCPFDEADWATTQKEDPIDMTSPNRFGLRKNGLTPAQIEAVRGGQWDLPTLQGQMREFVIHYDEIGLSRECFKILQDQRCLSIHFMCDLDGTIYQALDLKERAWQATIANTNSVGCEMANIGAYDPTQPTPFNQWYTTNAQGQTIITIPAEYGNGGIHTPGFVGQPSRPQPVAGNIQGQNLVQYDYTPQQYAALTKLIATFVSIFPAIPLSYPRNPTTGQLITVKLPDAQLAVYKGLLGHYHIQTDKIDPGPAFQWDLVVEGAKEIVLASQLRKARYHPPQEGKEANKAAPASLGAAAAASSPSAAKDQSASASSSSNNTLRRLERKLLQSAEDAAAREQLTSSMTLEDVEEQTLFYLVHAGWYAAMQAWLACEDDSVARPCAPTNHLLLSSDLRTPLSNLSLGRDYIPLGRPVWQELMDIYGGATPIVRKTADIYGIRAAGVSSPQQAASSSQLNGGASSPPSYASPASSSSPLIVPAVAPSSSSSSSSMPSVSLADGWMYVSKKLTGQ